MDVRFTCGTTGARRTSDQLAVQQPIELLVDTVSGAVAETSLQRCGVRYCRAILAPVAQLDRAAVS
jgi:hypothetical protein